MSKPEWKQIDDSIEYATAGAFGLTVEPPMWYSQWYWTVKPRRAKYTVCGYAKTQGAAKRAALRMARFLAGRQKEERDAK